MKLRLAKLSGMDESQLKKLREMESELTQYKRIVAEQTLQITILKDVIEKSCKARSGRLQHESSCNKSAAAHQIFGIHRSVYYYRANPKTSNQQIRDHLAELADLNPRWGF